MTRIPLAQVTLCAVDTRSPALAALSLLRSMAGIAFGRVVLFTHGWLPARVLPEIEIVEIAPITSGADYSRFVMRQLPQHVRTSHVLVTQWDGFVVEPAAWTNEFLAYDYVGAVWPEQPAALAVGNGGFSLRSRRFLAAGLDVRITEPLHPEDVVLCRTHRTLLEREHGIRFAPPALARRFAFENEPPRGPCLGFHGVYHLPRVLPEAAVAEVLAQMPDDFFRSRDARRLAKALLRARMHGTAAALIERRMHAGRGDPQTRLLGLLARAGGVLSGGGAPQHAGRPRGGG
jgi:hypothetical protein